MTQQVKKPPVTPASHTATLVQVQAAALPTQDPDNVPGKAEDDPRNLVPAPVKSTPLPESGAPGFGT